MIVNVNGVTAIAHEVRSKAGMLVGYTVTVNGQPIGNRIDRTVEDGVPTFTSIARNERVIASHDRLSDAVADVLNDGMRDRSRR